MSDNVEFELSQFALNAEPNTQFVYGSTSAVTPYKVKELAYALYEQGLVHLVQKRIDGKLHYVAVKRKVAERHQNELSKMKKNV